MKKYPKISEHSLSSKELLLQFKDKNFKILWILSLENNKITEETIILPRRK